MIMMNNNLRVFINVAESGSFTATANELYISQPAVSRAIKALEDELKVKLFFRDKRNGLILTDVGQKILLLARQMAALENRMYQTAFLENNLQSGTVKIAARPVLTSAILSQVLGSFRKEYPNISVEIIEGESMELNRMIEEHQVDFGLTFSPFGELEHKPLRNDQTIAISNTPFETGKPVNLEENHENYILCQSAVETIRASLGSKCPGFAHSTVVKQPETVIKLVEGCCGIGILSELAFLLNDNNLYVNTVSPEVDLEVAVTAVSFEELSPAAKLMADTIIEQGERIRKIMP